MDPTQPCQYSIRLIEKLIAVDIENKLDFSQIHKAIHWVKKYHAGQMRLTGDPFYSHPLEIAYMISDYVLQTEVIVASILHDTVEDTEITIDMISANFSWRVAEMVDRLTRDRPNGVKLSVKEILNNCHEKQDKEVLLIKLLDRIHNLQSIDLKSPEKMHKMINEVLIDFVLLSEYLGLSGLTKQIQQLCIKYQDKLNSSKDSYTQHNFSFNDSYQPLSLIYQNNLRL